MFAEFDLQHREVGLDSNLELIQSNTRFFLDYKAVEKGKQLELIIIYLIGIGTVTSLFHDEIRGSIGTIWSWTGL